jgi:hypothetical protein
VVFVLLLAGAILGARFLSTCAVAAPRQADSPTATPIDPPPATPPAQPTPIPAKPASTNSAPLLDGLAYSQSLGATHLIERGTISPRAGGYSATFQYERLKNLERIQMAGGNFVRNIGGNWVRADGWSTAGTPATATQTGMLNDLIGMANAAWSARSATGGAVTSLEPSKEESNLKMIYSVATQGGGQHIFTFRKTNSHLQLERFSGLVGNGPDQVQLNVDYTYPTDASATALIPSPTPSATPTPRRARARARARKTPAKTRSKAARRAPSPRSSP